MKIKKNGGGGVRSGRIGGQGGCERRIEVFFVKFEKKSGRGGGWAGSGWGIRVDVNKDFKFL